MLRQTTSLDVVSIRCQNNMDKSTWRNGRYFIEFEIQVDVGLSTWNQCHLFDVNSFFIIDEISTNFRYVILMLNRWQIEEDVSIGIT